MFSAQNGVELYRTLIPSVFPPKRGQDGFLKYSNPKCFVSKTAVEVYATLYSNPKCFLSKTGVEMYSTGHLLTIRNRKTGPGGISYLRMGGFNTNFSIRTTPEFLIFV